MEPIKRNKISTGSYDLNKWLYGGYDSEIISTIYGPAGSGKTNFCMLACISQAKKGNKVIYIDTEGGFSIDRLKQIYPENYSEIMGNILLLKPTNFQEQYKVFGQLLKEIRSKTNKIGLIIIDSITMLYRLELAENKENIGKVREINGILARQMRILSEIARKQELPVIITNQVYSEFLSKEDFEEGKQAGVKMVGGDILKYWSKCIIELKQEGRKRRAVLKKHRSLGEKELSFEIINSGIRRKGWI